MRHNEIGLQVSENPSQCILCDLCWENTGVFQMLCMDSSSPHHICHTILNYYRKDLKFVSEVEKEMKALVEAVNKVSNGGTFYFLLIF